MLRRRFIQLMTVAGATSLTTITPLEAADTNTITYKVKGFTCVTCAVGLETLLRQQKGVLWVKASYPDASATIKYQPATVTEDRLKAFIAEIGFTAEPEHRS
ncbi:heavy-metal-associated domain-containing protein [Alloacidobacterium dinghuense]|uniref:Heavy-metal-associated domain-containing protein n=1 Tax=Alloacidobacterium dinghuense TaxID=2763107 RepID=A0A7G8BQ71_9BACT|nr:heavy-metal-associated domain-containing protein [Alloacidobacterium dinghuense]QNI34691.1 heavy-metal-associated domain-containing protein [Alloacidobacterium dinghuense]